MIIIGSIFLVVVVILILLFAMDSENNPENNSSANDQGIPSFTPLPSDLPRASGEKADILADIAQKIGEISPVQPVLGGKWFIDRFWFVSGSNEKVYAEYEDGHILRKILLRVDSRENKYSYEVLAYFEPGDSDWAVKTGADSEIGKALELYEFDETRQSWVNKN